jgi:opacity protein-like surface antigen
MRKLLLGLGFASSALFAAGPISFGVKGGVPLNDAFHAVTSGSIQYVSNTKRYTVGPELDINLPFGLGIEVDALYRRLDFESTANTVSAIVRGATTANAWDIPILVKWRFGTGPVKPYVSAGPTFRNLTNIDQRVSSFFSGPNPSLSSAPELRDSFNTGVTLAGGLQFGAAGIRVSPEVRYIRWGWDNFRSPSTAFRSNRDQVDFMLGITF